MSSSFRNLPSEVISSREFIRHDDGLGTVPYYTSPGLQNLSTFAWQNNDLRAVPFILGGNCSKKIVEIGINMTVASVSGSKGRLGIYSDSGNVFPDQLIIDAGEVSISSLGFKSISNLNTIIDPGLYWLSLWLSLPSGTATTSVLTPATGLINTLGYDVVNLAGYSHYYVKSPYQSFPSIFPQPVLSRGGHPAIFIKFGVL